MNENTFWCSYTVITTSRATSNGRLQILNQRSDIGRGHPQVLLCNFDHVASYVHKCTLLVAQVRQPSCYGAARGMAREGRPGALPTADGKREGISFLILA
jgi:hypothetical protein